MTDLTVPTQKRLVLLAGRSHPELAAEVAAELGVPLSPLLAYDFSNGEIFVRFEESVRGCDAFVLQSTLGPRQQVDHGAADHGRRAQARLGQADHRDRTVLRLRPPGQEAPRPRADLRPPDGGPVQDRRRRPADVGRPAHLADPGLLRRAAGPPVRAAPAGRPRPVPGRHRPDHRRLPRCRPGPGGGALDRRPRRPPGDHPQAPGPRRAQPGAACSRWSATCTAASASSSTT